MQNPKKEISGIIHTLCTTRSAIELESTIMKYFTADARFSHPMCRASSRNEILGLFQWYRLAMYDSELDVMIVEVVEKVNVRFIPLPSRRGRMIVRLELRKISGRHYIAFEEDFTHPIDQIGFIASPLVPLASLFLKLGSVVSNLGACLFRTVGLTAGLRAGTISYAGLLEGVGLAQVQMDANLRDREGQNGNVVVSNGWLH
ncbi:hypothetical protein HYDPIDRAFT_25275 [Hydnomerulius pinastri MD-312]|nr:hypothetical protein HYDPIDRAFT_25275 [Hydnomerulius pinastri MD-312]